MLSAPASGLAVAEQSRLVGDLKASSGLSCSTRVVGVNAVSGDVTHVYSRGKQRVVFELEVWLHNLCTSSPSVFFCVAAGKGNEMERRGDE